MLTYISKKLQFIAYALGFYFPFYLFWALAFILSFDNRLFFGTLFAFSLFLGVIALSFPLYIRLEKAKTKWLALALVWFILTFYIAFLIAGSAGGLSMATVDSGPKGWEARYLMYALRALEITVDSQLLILPYLVVVVYIEKQMDSFFEKLLKVVELDG